MYGSGLLLYPRLAPPPPLQKSWDPPLYTTDASYIIQTYLARFYCIKVHCCGIGLHHLWVRFYIVVINFHQLGNDTRPADTFKRKMNFPNLIFSSYIIILWIDEMYAFILHYYDSCFQNKTKHIQNTLAATTPKQMEGTIRTLDALRKMDMNACDGIPSVSRSTFRNTVWKRKLLFRGGGASYKMFPTTHLVSKRRR